MKKKYYSPTFEEQEITTSCGIMSNVNPLPDGGGPGGSITPMP